MTVWYTGLLYKLSKSMPYWFTRLVGLLLRDQHFRVHMGNDNSAWRPQRNGLPQGSVLALVLFNLYSNDLPVTRGRYFSYADDICLAIGVTLDHTLSYREHLTKTAGKLKNQNNLLMKLAGST